MIRDETINELADRLDMPLTKIAVFYDVLFAFILMLLKEQHRFVRIPGFGTFYLNQSRELTFRPAKKLRRIQNPDGRLK